MTENNNLEIIVNMEEKDILRALAIKIVNENLPLFRVKDELTEMWNNEKISRESEYFIHMYGKLQKYGYDKEGYSNFQKSIYVLEEISKGFTSVDSIVKSLSSRIGTSEMAVYQNMFDSRFTIYTALRYAMAKYIRQERSEGKKARPEVVWSAMDDNTKMTLYVELEKFLYSL